MCVFFFAFARCISISPIFFCLFCLFFNYLKFPPWFGLVLLWKTLNPLKPKKKSHTAYQRTLLLLLLYSKIINYHQRITTITNQPTRSQPFPLPTRRPNRISWNVGREILSPTNWWTKGKSSKLTQNQTMNINTTHPMSKKPNYFYLKKRNLL